MTGGKLLTLQWWASSFCLPSFSVVFFSFLYPPPLLYLYLLIFCYFSVLQIAQGQMAWAGRYSRTYWWARLSFLKVCPLPVVFAPDKMCFSSFAVALSSLYSIYLFALPFIFFSLILPRILLAYTTFWCQPFAAAAAPCYTLSF